MTAASILLRGFGLDPAYLIVTAGFTSGAAPLVAGLPDETYPVRDRPTTFAVLDAGRFTVRDRPTTFLSPGRGPP